MKRNLHIFTYLIFTLLIISCEKSELTHAPTPAEKAITYSTEVSTTRASQTTTTTLQDYGKFNIATFLTDNDNTHYFTDKVLYNGSVWKSIASRYWPVNYDLNMFAYSPISDFITITNETSQPDYSLTYNCPADISKQIDLLVKTLENQTNKNTAIALKFNHALSSLKFKVKFENESNVTLKNILINYIGIENERTFNFASQDWDNSAPKYFDSSSGAATALNVNKTLKTNDATKNPILFDEIEDVLMIIPQNINTSEDTPHFISIQIEYTLNSTLDENKTEVLTGIMPLPAPDSDNKYKKGELYTYNIKVNGEKITFSDVSISNQDNPVAAYGNINLGLITSSMTAEEIGYTKTSETGSQYYFTSAKRVKDLFLDGVRDFVVIGSMGASKDNHLGEGKLGYYGSKSSPFFIGADLAKDISGEDYLFSVDLRGTYDYPEFQYANNDENGNTASVTSSDIAPTDPIMVAGLFSGVKGLKEVFLPHGIVAIGNHAFENCISLETIDIADVLHIEIGTFQGATALKTVENGALTRIHDNSFDGCTSLKTINLSQITQIDKFGFVNCTNLTNVNLSKLDIIGDHAFDGCGNLTIEKNTIVPSFSNVSDYAFSGCSKLGTNGSKIDLTETLHVGDHAFNECTEIVLSDGDLISMLTIGNNAFTNCKHMGSKYEITLPKITSIGSTAFAGCPLLNIIDGLDNLKIINSSTFQGCTNFTGYSSTATTKLLNLPLVEIVDELGFNASGVTNVAFDKNKLTTINNYAFNDCTSLTEISGLDNVTKVGDYAFGTCSTLEELSLPSLEDGGWGVNFFSACKSLKVVSLPLLSQDSITYIDSDNKEQTNTIIEMIDASYTNIENVDLRNLVTNIPGWAAFQDKVHLKSVNFASATSIGNGAFHKCIALEVANFSSATSIGSMALLGCNNLKRLNLSGIIDSDNIGEGVFWEFTNGEKCELWLSDKQAAEANGKTWQGITWKAIHKASDNVEFTM